MPPLDEASVVRCSAVSPYTYISGKYFGIQRGYKRDALAQKRGLGGDKAKARSAREPDSETYVQI